MATNIYQEKPEFILGDDSRTSFISFQENNEGEVIINTEFSEEKTKLTKEDWLALRQFLDLAFWNENEE
jgi:hypothetical protein